MSDDVVEIIEIQPMVIEISDDECDENDNVTVISDNLDNANVVIIQDESTETSIKIEEHNDELTSFKTTNQRNRKRRRNRIVKQVANSINTVQAANEIADGICHKVAKKAAGSIPCATEPSTSGVIKQEANSISNEISINCTESIIVENNVLQNDCLPNHSSINGLTASSSVVKLQPKNNDYSKISWLKPLNNLSSPPHLQLVIIDRGHPDWKIKNDKWLMIEKRLLESLHREMLRNNDNSIGSFDGAKWQRGIKVVGCHNKKTLNFIKNFILKLDNLWTGAKLDVCTMAHFVRQICKVFIPPPILKTEVVLSLIKLQNPSISCDDWEFLGEQERNHGIDMWLSVNEESYTQLCRLGGEIKYGINRVFVNPVL